MAQRPRPILLTGAGFTHNFGGYLARDMWAEIFNHQAVQRHRPLHEAMRRSFNFEDAYDDVLYSGLSGEEKGAMIEGVRAAFSDLDEIVMRFEDTRASISLNALARFIERFAGLPGDPGYIFTLNQDLFIERQVPFDGVLVALPGLRKGNRFNRNTFRHCRLDSIRLQLPSQDAVEKLEAEYPRNTDHLVYVKLHGSTEWESNDGAFRPVIGRQKSRIIENEPLLKWYGRLPACTNRSTQ